MEDQTTECGLVMMNGIIKTWKELGKVRDLQVQILQASEGKEKLDDGDERQPLP
jgi:CHAD domain-containing protein